MLKQFNGQKNIKLFPGLVHLHVRFGYQGLWFVDGALFSFSFTGKEGITFLNSSVLFWFFIFIINRINYNFFKEGKKLYGLSWMIIAISEHVELHTSEVDSHVCKP